MLRTIKNLLFLALMAILGGACAPSPTILHPEFGQSVKAFKQAQILNPQATGSEEPVEGFEGVAADKTVKQYEKSFTKKQRSTFGSILLSPGGQGQGGQ